MNCLNCSKFLREAIDSVYAQTYPHWEIIFWDNASTDCSGDIAQSYDSRLRYFRGEETVPLGAARNKALEQARGEFIAFLDCDDIWMPKKLEKQIPLFADPQVGLVFCDTIFFNDKGESERFYSRRRYTTGDCFSILLNNYFLSMETIVIKSAVLRAEKEWFDPRFNMIEDADFFRRIAYRWHLAMVDEPLAKWRVHASSWSWAKSHLFAEENLALLAKYHEIFPDFATAFAPEIRRFERHIALGKAKYLWQSGRPTLARRALTPYLGTNIKLLVFFLMTFFPRYLVDSFLKKFSKSSITPV